MVGHSNLGSPTRSDARRQGQLAYYGIRHEGRRILCCLGLREAHGTTGSLSFDRRPRCDESPDRPLGCPRGPVAVLALTGQVEHPGPRPRCVSGSRLCTPAYGRLRNGANRASTAAGTPSCQPRCKSAILNRGVSHLIFPTKCRPGLRLKRPRRVAQRADSLPATLRRPRIHRRGAGSALQKRPVIIVRARRSVSSCRASRARRRLQCPVLTTFKGKGTRSPTDIRSGVASSAAAARRSPATS